MMATVQELFLAGEVECLECGRRGTAKRVELSGISTRVLTWLPATKSGKPVVEPWDWNTPPSFCPRCWQKKADGALVRAT